MICLYDPKEECIEEKCFHWKKCKDKIEINKLFQNINILQKNAIQLNQRILKIEKEIRKNARTSKTKTIAKSK